MNRRELLHLGFSGLSVAVCSRLGFSAQPPAADVHAQLLALAAEQEQQRRARFAAVQSHDDLQSLQASLRESFLRLIGGLPTAHEPPAVQKLDQIEADDYVVEKLLVETLHGYFMPALLYRPARIDGKCPGVISPCGHSTEGKAAGTYQILHVNLAKRGYVVLTYDPVGQAERSQFWDSDKKKSRFNLTCGEHAVLGNPMYLLGTSLAKYRIWDGMRAIDYLVTRKEVDAQRIGCVGNSGGGTLTAYIAALDPRVTVAAICCYITTLPRRMGNRIEADPDADPEQDIFGFVSEGIDHAGLVALRTPRPTLLGTARFDFFPIEGARESFAEAQHLYEVAGASDRIARVEAAERHGLSLPLRTGVYDWFDRWLAERNGPPRSEEVAFTPRSARDLLVCPDGQVNTSFRSRPLLPLALEQFDQQKKPPRAALKDLLYLDPKHAAPAVFSIAEGANDNSTTVLCINGNESPDWREERSFLDLLAKQGFAVAVVDPRGVSSLRPDKTVKGHEYADPLAGVEENIAYNAFLVGKCLAGMRVADVLAAVERISKTGRTKRLVLCGRRDAALIACLAAAIEPAITHVAAEELHLDLRGLFVADAQPINAASIVPGLLAQFGDMPDVLAQIAPRKVLAVSPIGQRPRESSAQFRDGRLTDAGALNGFL